MNNDSQTATHKPLAGPGTDSYTELVAEPTMRAVDGMPEPYRRLIHEFGYVDVYRAWKRGMSPQRIREQAVGGVFAL